MDQFVMQGAKAVDLNGVEIGTVDRVYRERETDTILSQPIGGERIVSAAATYWSGRG